MAMKQTETSAYIQKRERKREMKYYLVSFALMIIFTVLSFATVAMDNIPKHFTSGFIVILAIGQVIFQLYYFMHMKDEDHGFPSLFIYGGAMVVFITILTFVSIVWI